MTTLARATAKWQAAIAWRAAAPKGYRAQAQARVDEAARELLRIELRGRKR